MNETFICRISSENKTIVDIDEFRCFLEKLAALLFNYNFGYICMGIVLLIIFISIFGGIKERYKWFILYQAIWDLFVSYQYSCENYAHTYDILTPSSCFYYAYNLGVPRSNPYGLFFNFFISGCLINNFFSALFLLSLSRFLAIYYPLLYDKFTAKWKLLKNILVFTIIIIFFDTYLYFTLFKAQRNSFVLRECKTQQYITNLTDVLCQEQANNEFLFKFLNILQSIFTLMMFLKPILCLLFSLFAAIMIIIKILKQAKFQRKHNPNDFKNSVRIALVIFLQTLLNLFVLILESIYKFELNLAPFFGIKILISINTFVEGQDYTGYFDFRLPLWLDGNSGLTYKTSRQMVTQIRVLVESILVLLIMTGYREAIVAFVKFIYTLSQNPRKAYQIFLSHFTKKKSSQISLF